MSATLSQIIRSMKTFRDPNKYPPIRISGFSAKHWIGTKTILYQAIADSQTKQGASKYNVSMQFHDIEYSKERRPGMLATDPIDGQVWYFSPPIIGSNDVQIKCMCTDFRHTFSWEDKAAKALIGATKPYTPVSPPSGRPPRNPKHVLGLCKHLWSFAKYLKASNLIQGQLV